MGKIVLLVSLKHYFCFGDGVYFNEKHSPEILGNTLNAIAILFCILVCYNCNVAFYLLLTWIENTSYACYSKYEILGRII